MDTITRKDSVAAIIKQQVGFWALAEVGARGFMFDEKSLYFDAKPTTRIVRVKIWLTADDLYTVQVFHKRTHAVLFEVEGIYADMLAETVRSLPKAV